MRPYDTARDDRGQITEGLRRTCPKRPGFTKTILVQAPGGLRYCCGLRSNSSLHSGQQK